MSAEVEFKMGDLVVYRGERYIFYCDITLEMAEQDGLGVPDNWAYLDSLDNTETVGRQRLSHDNKYLKGVLANELTKVHTK